MRILVTGNSGFIGARLVHDLLAFGHEIIGIDRVQPDPPQPIQHVTKDIRFLEDFSIFDPGFDCIFHLAAARADWGLSEEEYYRDNVETTRVVIELGRHIRVKKWLFFSTVSVLGPSGEALDETAPLRPTTAYGSSKADAEALFYDLAQQDPNNQVLILRPSVVFGPGHPPDTNIFRLIESLRRERFLMVGEGKESKATSYVSNLLAATHYVSQCASSGLWIYHYVDYPLPSTGELVAQICDSLGRAPPRISVPLKAAIILGYPFDVVGTLLNVDFPITAARIRKFKTPTSFSADKIRRLGFQQPVTLNDAIATTARWHLASPREPLQA